jgi:hypothetical protein
MALFLLENRDFLGFWMIFKVWPHQIFQTLTQCCGPLNTGKKEKGQQLRNGKCEIHRK